MESIRLDKLLVQRGYAQSRERAQILIKAGYILVDGNSITKTSKKCTPNATIILTEDIPWVSRAGLKLEKALEIWPVSVAGARCLDIGASTGGFTEVLIYQGAKEVYALDVGYDQLAQRLRENPYVVVIENKNIREVTSDSFSEPFNVITVDVSYISLEYVLPRIAELLSEDGEAIVLIKPQFEVGKTHIQKGVVRDPDLHRHVIDTIQTIAIKEGLTPIDKIESPIQGSKGNKEYLIYLKNQTIRTR